MKFYKTFFLWSLLFATIVADEPNVKLSAISAFHLWNNNPIQTMAFQVAGEWEELSILVVPVVVNDPYGPDLLGVDYTRSGLSGRITNAFVRY